MNTYLLPGNKQCRLGHCFLSVVNCAIDLVELTAWTDIAASETSGVDGAPGGPGALASLPS